jgi:hypothetical protein
MAESIAELTLDREPPLNREREADPLHFLAGRRYTCYCGRDVVGTMLCPECADDMVDYFLRVARRPKPDP